MVARQFRLPDSPVLGRGQNPSNNMIRVNFASIASTASASAILKQLPGLRYADKLDLVDLSSSHPVAVELRRTENENSSVYCTVLQFTNKIVNNTTLEFIQLYCFKSLEVDHSMMSEGFYDYSFSGIFGLSS